MLSGVRERFEGVKGFTGVAGGVFFPFGIVNASAERSFMKAPFTEDNSSIETIHIVVLH